LVKIIFLILNLTVGVYVILFDGLCISFRTAWIFARNGVDSETLAGSKIPFKNIKKICSATWCSIHVCSTLSTTVFSDPLLL
jgi:hypothetical protein